MPMASASFAAFSASDVFADRKVTHHRSMCERGGGRQVLREEGATDIII